MLTALNVKDLKNKFSQYGIRKSIDFNKVDIIKIINYKGCKKYLNLVVCAFDKEKYSNGYYQFTVTDKPYEKSNILYTLNYQRGIGVQEV